MRQKRVALVTGGAQGIGKGTARQLMRDGYSVVIADSDDEAGNETAAQYGTIGSITFVPTDVGDEAAVQYCMNQVIEHYGQLDALINNAGIAAPTNAPIEQLALRDWNRVITTNLTGYFLMTKYAAPHLRATHGAIVNIASTRAVQSEPHTEAYAASKGGIVALTHALAISLGPDVRVHCISPGWIDVSAWQKTSERRNAELRAVDHTQHPAGRVGVPEDVAALVAFLIGDAAGFITGQHFVVDGGMTRKMIYAE